MIHAPRSLVFQVVAAAVGVNALAGIFALLSGSGNLGETETRILLTALTLSFASILLLAPVATWQQVRFEGFPFLPAASAACISSAAVVITVAIWAEPANSENLAKVVLTLGTLGIGFGHVSLLMLARPGTLRTAAIAVSLLLVAELIGAIWGTGVSGDDKWRLIGITSILAIALSVLVPVRSWAASSGSAIAVTSVRYCPFCGHRGSFETMGGVCSRCGSRFEVSKPA